MNRRAEIGKLLQLSPEEVRQRAGKHLIVYQDVHELHQRMAEDICNEIIAHNAQSQLTRLIVPVGPTGQYPILVKLLRERQVTLENCWFFFMDEYCDDSGKAVDTTHPLSFKRIAQDLFLDHVHVNQDQVFFPDENNIDLLPKIIAEIDGLDTCYGGIGIHGHIAFNEPEPHILHMGARKVRLNDFTVTINAIRSHVGGNLGGFPRYAYTLGMKEIVQARHIRLYCRNGCEFDWANTVLRLALFGYPGDDYPVTHIRKHNYVIVTDENTLASPKHIL